MKIKPFVLSRSFFMIATLAAICLAAGPPALRGVANAGAAAAAGKTAATAGASPAAAEEGSRPNILLIMADDLTWNDIEPYGNDEVHTPSLARLAREGISLDNMFTSTAMCAPTRQQLLTGMYPVRSGAYPNHSRVYDGTKSLVHHLQALGYRTGLLGKKHIRPEASYPFTYLGDLRGAKMKPGKAGMNLDKAGAFMARSDAGPFFLMVAAHEPHEPWKLGNTAAYPPESLKLPPGFVDTRITRQQRSQYYAEITYLDSLVGVCLDMLDAFGRRGNTLVIFTSEQGSSFAFSKWTCYDSGLKTAFIARWPGRISPGSRNKALVQYVDIAPTLVQLAGGDPAKISTGVPDASGNKGFDGKSFADLLLGRAQSFRDYVFGVHTTRGIIDGSACYPIRSARSERYLYIRNLNYQADFSNVKTKGRDSFLHSWFQTGKEEDAARAQFYIRRPQEELYDVVNDPYQLENLAGKPGLEDVREHLGKQLDAFMKQQGDQGIATEMKALERQPKNK